MYKRQLLYLWLVIHRTRVMAMEDLLDDRRLDDALAARRAEVVPSSNQATSNQANSNQANSNQEGTV